MKKRENTGKIIGKVFGEARALGVTALAAAVMLSGCGNAGNQAQKGGSGAEQTENVENGENAAENTQISVIIAMPPTSEPEAGFDPAYGWGAGEHMHEPLIQSTLTVTEADLSIGYDLATDVETSEDGMTWTVTIRDDAKFTDGEALTAEDVAFTYNTLKKTSSVNDFSMLKQAEAIDDETVVFEMERPFAIWSYTMAVTGIVPEHAYGTDYGTHPIGSGRYILKQWDKGQQVILEANPDYYGDAPKMRQVTILFMEEDAAFAAVRAGQVDVAYTAASYADQSVPEFSLLDCETVDNRGFNLPAVPETVRGDGVKIGNDFTADVQVRRAINLAIDRQEMIDHVLNGYGSPAYSVCDKMPWYNDEMENISYDVEKAEEMLDAAGWKKNADGIREKGGVKAILEFLYPTGDSVRQALAADTAQQLKEIGIDTSIRGTGWDTAYDEAQSQPLLWGWGAHTPMEFYNIYHTKADTGLAEYSPYANETVDAYMDEALAAPDLESSYELWKKAQWDGETGVSAEGDLPWIWLVNVDHLYWVLGSMAPEQIEKLQAYWGVGVPVWKRFFSWISGICHGDFGISLLYRRPVLEVIAEKASASVWLLLSAWLFSGIVGIFLGIAAAVKRGKWVDRLITGYCIVIAGTPSFWLALVLLLLFTVQLPVFPIGFSVPVGMAADEVSLADRLYHAFLPACTLGLTGISSIAMHTREKVIEILESDYVLYARARGESGWRLIFRHGLRNLLLPVITLQFGSISEIFGGSVLVEQVFSYPGLGQAAVTAGLGSDIPLLMGITLISAVLVFAGNAAADGLYRLVDPRLRKGGRA